MEQHNIGPGFLGLLALLLIGLKVTGKTNMSWFWVLAPIWMPIIMLTLIVIGIIIAT